MTLWAMPCRATQDGWVIVESSDKTWSTGEGNGKPLLYTYRENIMNCIEKAGMLQSMGSQRVRHNWATEKQPIGTNRLPWWLSSEECACSMGCSMGSIPGSGRSPREGNGNPLQYSCLRNPMGRGAWWATVHRVAKSRTWLSDLACTHECLPEQLYCYAVYSQMVNIKRFKVNQY